MAWFLIALTRYGDFGGRARRKEYWMFALFSVLITLVLGTIDVVVGLRFRGMGLLSTVASFALLVPGTAVSVRRLHDTGRSGLWLLLTFVPVFGGLALLYFLVQDSEPGDNRFGPNPKGEVATYAYA